MTSFPSGIRDNHARGSVADFLRTNLRPGSDLDLVTAYFTVFAYDKLRAHLDNLGRIRLLFGEAAFIKNLDPDKADGAAYVLRDDGLALSSGLNQRHLAQACAKWMRDKVEVRSVTRTGFLHGTAATITLYPVVPDYERYEYGRDLAYTSGGIGLAGHWLKLSLHYLFIYKAKAQPGWQLIPE